MALASYSYSRIPMDRDASGHGWFIDSTPLDSSEYQVQPDGTRLALGGSEAAQQIDLLSVFMHEIGHALGLDHDTSDHESSVMSETLSPGTRIQIDSDHHDESDYTHDDYLVAMHNETLETGLSFEQQNNDEPDTALLFDNSFTPSTVVNEQDPEQRAISNESLPSGQRKRLSDWLFNWYRNRS